ncbi:hypothetical protein SAMN05216228_100859 [Rhizobium tibeticum]|uniref:Uncharacterized protein n=1 Tax=Rhizobium tibeticum TaxID=501024 RepID=A0A1H8JTV5_9HYPH|nr:hypothetical protein [Rhizobium tibeticum]SEH79398.1 hypothetical protein RTCCBAU85039_2399 [Rhizobium tibeticum]SEN84183.1 hypothetical protein SAMN05216228_100859 [Rhizobium tibeticum]
MTMDAPTTARRLVETAIAHFRSALTAENAVVPAIRALDDLVTAAVAWPDLGDHEPGLAARVSELAFAIAPRVAEGVAGAIAADRVYFGLAAGAALLTAKPDNLHADRILHAGLIAAELRAAVCRSELKRRNDPLGRAVTAQRAWEAPADHNVSLQ